MPFEYKFDWMPDRGILFYANRNSAQVWAYDVATQKSEPYPGDFPWQPDNTVLANLPPEAQDVVGSPSGTKMLYTLPVAHVTSTPNPDGPVPHNNDPVQLWLWDGGRSRQLGDVTNCIGDYLWSSNEQVVIILPDAPPGKCEVEAWILNLQAGSLTPWRVMSNYDTSINITDVKADGSAVLFSTLQPEGSLFVRDLKGNTDTLVLNHPGVSMTGVWLHGEQQLLIRTISSDPLSSQLWVYDAADTELLKVEMSLPDLFVGRWQLSHDRNWLAFLTRERDAFQSNGLWVADLSAVP